MHGNGCTRCNVTSPPAHAMPCSSPSHVTRHCLSGSCGGEIKHLSVTCRRVFLESSLALLFGVERTCLLHLLAAPARCTCLLHLFSAFYSAPGTRCRSTGGDVLVGEHEEGEAAAAASTQRCRRPAALAAVDRGNHLSASCPDVTGSLRPTALALCARFLSLKRSSTAPACSPLQARACRMHRFIVYLQPTRNARAALRLDRIPAAIIRRRNGLENSTTTRPKSLTCAQGSAWSSCARGG